MVISGPFVEPLGRLLACELRTGDDRASRTSHELDPGLSVLSGRLYIEHGPTVMHAGRKELTPVVLGLSHLDIEA
jgi:hypothetical protein